MQIETYLYLASRISPKLADSVVYSSGYWNLMAPQGSIQLYPSKIRHFTKTHRYTVETELLRKAGKKQELVLGAYIFVSRYPCDCGDEYYSNELKQQYFQGNQNQVLHVRCSHCGMEHIYVLGVQIPIRYADEIRAERKRTPKLVHKQRVTLLRETG